MSGPTRRGRMVRALKWLSFPFLVQFFRSYQVVRDGMRALADMRPDQDMPAAVARSQIEDDAIRQQARSRTRRYGRFCALLLIVVIAMWGHAVFWNGEGILSPASIRSLALSLILGTQYVSLCFSNWMARSQRRGSFSDFLQDGRDFWPR
ncbi:MAG: hypothetical protein ABF876_17865 [Acetobacter aceti]